MNKFYTLLAALLIAATTFAQSPESMSYQAVVRDGSDVLVSNSMTPIQISILKDAVAVYVETQTPTTNNNGLLSIEIGGSGAAVVSGVFSDINWGAGTYFIKTEVDVDNNGSYDVTGTNQLLSVPYALYAKATEPPVSTVMTDEVSRNVTTTWTEGPTFSTIIGFKASSFVKISYIIPSRNDTPGWGGLYIEPQISFDDGSNWNSLGSSGYDGGIMHVNSASIGSYTNTLLIDPQQTTSFSVKIRFYFRSYQNITIINSNNGINTSSGTATIMSGTNGLQHYTKVIVEEVFQ